MTQYDIAEELMNDINANWTRSGAFALAEYFEQIEEDLGESIEFDRVAIRCDFSQYESLQKWAHDSFSNAKEEMGFDESEEIDDDDFDEKIREYIMAHGQLIEFNGGVIVSQF